MKDEIVQAVSQLLAARVSVHVSDLSTPFATKRHLLCVLLNPRMGAMGPLGPMGPAMPMPMPGSRFREIGSHEVKVVKAWSFAHAGVVAGIEASICRNGPSSAGFIPRDRIIQVKTTWQHACMH